MLPSFRKWTAGSDMTPVQRALHSDLLNGLVRQSLYSLHSLPEAVRLAEKEAARRRSHYGEEHPKNMQMNAYVTASDDVPNWAVSKLSGPRSAVVG